MKIGDCVRLWPKIWDNGEELPSKMDPAPGDPHWSCVGIIIATRNSSVFDHTVYTVMVGKTHRIFMKDEMEVINEDR